MSAATKSVKPFWPYSDVVKMTAHPRKQWCKKVRGRLYYFGTWDQPQEALELWLEQKDALLAGRKPRERDEPTVSYLINHFLDGRQKLIPTGELTQRTYDDYVKVCKRVGRVLGRDRIAEDLREDDFSKLRNELATSDKGRALSPQTRKREVSIARMIFHNANEHRLTKEPIVYRPFLKAPKARTLRKARRENGIRLFNADQIRALIEAAGPQLRGMIYLAINCGLGNHDCGTLPVSAVDLERGWLDYPRPKTEMDRRCPLWPDTIAALQAIRPRNGLVFSTKYGNPWTVAEHSRANPISYEFRKLCKKVGVYRKGNCFYSLRRTFQTVGDTSGEHLAVKAIMGHVPDVNNMSAIYNQLVPDEKLQKVTEYVRGWLLGVISIGF